MHPAENPLGADDAGDGLDDVDGLPAPSLPAGLSVADAEDLVAQVRRERDRRR